jgi:glycosyltransferase involved in cell wall biosynthesis
VRWQAWSEKVEATALQGISVGVMPLPDNEWTRGKCSFKMLQYLAVGAPAVVSPVGLNRTILRQGEVALAAVTDDEWYQALETLYRDWDLQQRLGRAGRQVVERHYNADVIAGELARIFRTLARR